MKNYLFEFAKCYRNKNLIRIFTVLIAILIALVIHLFEYYQLQQKIKTYPILLATQNQLQLKLTQWQQAQLNPTQLNQLIAEIKQIKPVNEFLDDLNQIINEQKIENKNMNVLNLKNKFTYFDINQININILGKHSSIIVFLNKTLKFNQNFNNIELKIQKDKINLKGELFYLEPNKKHLTLLNRFLIENNSDTN